MDVARIDLRRTSAEGDVWTCFLMRVPSSNLKGENKLAILSKVCNAIDWQC